ncbi:hypothetical protein MMC10_005487 [Thelotrema lepadinum]|nr:hypothetical protein [Thelotrema lepadinum]
MNAPDPAARASAALEHLRLLFGDTLRRQVIMLQEVLLESLQAILDNPWVQTNFAVSNVCPPNSLCTDVLGETFVMTRVDWRAEPYFTLIMVSKDMGVIDCLRIPFVTEMGRDALAVDIHVCDPSHTDQTLPPERAQPLRSIRICTTHLESLWQGKFRAMRLEQLATISALLKGTPSMNSRPIGGLVGGDMNSVGPAEHEFHKDRSVDLKDVWNGDSLPPLPMKEPGQGDKTYGRSTGSTWGHHADSPRRSKRVDKFLYTGSIEVVALSELQDFTGEVGRLGIILKTKVKASKIKEKRKPIKLGKDVQEGSRKYLTKGQADWERAREWRLRHWSSKYTPEQRNVWVSDHFGIAVGIKVL